MPKYISTTEAAKIAGYNDDGAIRSAIRRGKLNAEKYGRNWLITPTELDRWLKDETHYNLKSDKETT